jgi:hypothetical protein
MRFPLRNLLGPGLMLISLSAVGQTSQAKPVLPAISNLRSLNQNAGYIFDGTVLAIEPVASNETGVAAVKITFRIEQAIRGTHFGQVLAIREWAGLWSSGERYRLGERLLLFLYRPSKLGFTSPVRGAFGRFAVDSRGNALLVPGHLPALALDPVSLTHLRQTNRVNARVLAFAIQSADTE